MSKLWPKDSVARLHSSSPPPLLSELVAIVPLVMWIKSVMESWWLNKNLGFLSFSPSHLHSLIAHCWFLMKENHYSI